MSKIIDLSKVITSLGSHTIGVKATDGTNDSALSNTVAYDVLSITQTLSNCTSSLTATTTYIGEVSPSFTITPSTGYNFGTGATYSVYNGTTPVTLTVSDGIIAVPEFIVGGAVTVNVSAVLINYSVSNTLTNCTSNNSATSVSPGASYSATLTAASGYTLTGATASVTMGGVDITSTAYSQALSQYQVLRARLR